MRDMKRLAILLGLAFSTAALAQYVPKVGTGEPGYTIPKPYSSEEGNRTMEAGTSFRGEVEGIDKVSGTVTLKHSSIGILGVPGGTKDYAVKDSALLDKVKVGDRVRFQAVMQGRSLIVTSLAPAN